MHELKKLIGSVRSQLYVSAMLRSLLLALSLFLVISVFVGTGHWFSWLGALIGLGLGAWLTKIYQDKKRQSISLIHQHVGEVEYSLHLLEKEELNLADQLQIERLGQHLHNLSFPFSKLYKGLGWYFLLLLVSLGIYIIYPKLSENHDAETQISADSKVEPIKIEQLKAPVFESAKVFINPPTYTRLPHKHSEDLNISAIEGSVLKWEIVFNHNEKLQVKLANARGDEVAFKKQANIFTHTDRLAGSGIYAIKAYWKDSLIYQSDFYRLEAVTDRGPQIEPASKEFHKFHYLKDPKILNVSASISDDFSVDQAFIIATVARGSGENVKFREMRFPLTPSHFKEANIKKSIDLKALNFAPGDELYYYWGAIDNKQPHPNFTKSDTYFLVFKDTAQIEEAELATMAVNIMPEYFRSQRQIIIDTEKLIARKKKLSQKEFASISNEIGFDQKVLRLRYGQYLGEEFETSIGGSHDGAEMSTGDILDSFTHKSDGDGETYERHGTEPAHHEEHDHDHGNEKAGNGSQDALAALMEQYVHSHDDAETNTFYEESTRSLLKMALENMWQSELHLRMYEPEKAIPFEKKALEFLKSAQHKARTFVKKSGYDPPPIKEKEKRLTGELKDTNNKQTSEKLYDQKRIEELASEVLGYLDEGSATKGEVSQMKAAAAALSDQMIKGSPFNGGLQNWNFIAVLQKLVNGKSLSSNERNMLKSELYKRSNPSVQSLRNYSSDKKLEDAFWKKMK